MSLRNKLLLLLAGVIISAVSLSSAVLYTVARRELESAARHRLRQEAKLLAALGRDRFKLELRRLQQWSKTQIVIQTALHYQDPKVVSAFETYFKAICAQEPYQSLYLIDRQGDCVAASSPRRLYYPYFRSVISKEPVILKAWRGYSSISPTVLSLTTGRPSTPITAPVMQGNKVIGVLRMIIDTGLLNKELLTKLHIHVGERAYVFDPNLNMHMPRGIKPEDPMKAKPYVRPDISIPPKQLVLPYGEFRYSSDSGPQLAAFARMKNSRFVFLVTQPMFEVLSPIRTVRDVALILTGLLLILGLIGLFAVLNPVLSGIDRCRKLAAAIHQGMLGEKAPVISNDEIGQLTQGLNEMSAQLLSNRQVLEAAEKEYRSIFENAVGGIFQTDGNGVLLNANPAFIRLFGVSSLDDLSGTDVSDWYDDPGRQQQLINQLQSEGEVKNFDLDIRRTDGVKRRCRLSARAAIGKDRQITVIQGIIEDVTERYEARAARERAREMTRHLSAARLKALRFQVNPHFLFNVMNTLDILSRKDPGRIPDLLGHLARYLRYSLETRDNSLVPLNKELHAIEAYLEIEKTRFTENLKVSLEVEETVKNRLIPEMLFQPLVQNAVKYGMLTSQMPLHLVLGASLRNGYLNIFVRNSGHWMKPSKSVSGTRIGLKNLRRRLKLTYERDATIKIVEKAGWVTVRIILPDRGASDNESD